MKSNCYVKYTHQGFTVTYIYIYISYSETLVSILNITITFHFTFYFLTFFYIFTKSNPKNVYGNLTPIIPIR